MDSCLAHETYVILRRIFRKKKRRELQQFREDNLRHPDQAVLRACFADGSLVRLFTSSMYGFSRN